MKRKTLLEIFTVFYVLEEAPKKQKIELIKTVWSSFNYQHYKDIQYRKRIKKYAVYS